jgi:hypothetical protein
MSLSSSVRSRTRATFAPPPRVRGRADGDAVTPSPQVIAASVPASVPSNIASNVPAFVPSPAAVVAPLPIHNVEPDHLCGWYIVSNLMYVLVFAVIIAITVLTWYMYSQTHANKSVSTAPGSSFDRILLASSILATISVFLTVFVLWRTKSPRNAYNHILRYTS